MRADTSASNPVEPPVRAALRRLALVLSTAFALALAGCAAPSPSTGKAAPMDPAAAAAAPAEALAAAPVSPTVQNPPRPPQLPPVRRPSPRPALGPGLRAGDGNGSADGTVAAGTVKIDRSCDTDAECTVKDVGNCCGYYPACVNVDSPTDPEGVKAQCAKSGMASVCGFPAITRCQCVAGQCEGSSQALLD